MPDIFIGNKEIKEEPEETTTEDKPNSEKNIVKADIKPLHVKKSDKHKHYHVFASYCERPPEVVFADKLEEEELLLFLRKHFVTNVPWIIKTVILALIPFLIVTITSLGFVNIDFLPAHYVIMIILFYYFLVSGYIFVNYLTWFYNTSLVTTQRIIDIDFSSIVFENVAATKLTQVEDVSYSQIGVIRSVFDYGDVLIQTAGSKDEFEFLAVPHPEKVINTINNLIGENPNA